MSKKHAAGETGMEGFRRRAQRPLAALALCGAAALSLQACMPIIAGGAVMGTLAATDRRTLGAQTEDRGIVLKGESRIGNVVGEAGHVNVNSFNRKVLLTGEVRDEAMKAAVEREITAIENVQSIVNELEVALVSSIASRSNDSLITGRIKAAFVDNKALQANSIKVVTERGTVFLMGRVTQREGYLAGEVARNISGVRKVVKVFDYINEEELQQMSSGADTQGRK